MTKVDRKKWLFTASGGLLISALVLAGCAGNADTKTDQTNGGDSGDNCDFGNVPDELMDLAKKSCAESGDLMWYESTAQELIDPFLDAAADVFPWLSIEHVSGSEDGTDIGGRIIQEVQAGQDTADFTSSGQSTMLSLAERDLLGNISADDFSVLPEAVDEDMNAVLNSASVYVIAYNSDEVTGDDIPTKWEDITDPKWKGKVGAWSVAAGQAMLAKEWGKDKALAFNADLAANEPRLYSSTAPIADAISAGEIDLAFTLYNTTLPAIEAGAPVDVVFADPTPANGIYSGIIEGTDRPASAQLLIEWMNTKEGATALQESSSRSNPMVDTGLIEGYDPNALSTWGMSETEEYQALMGQMGDVLKEGGE